MKLSTIIRSLFIVSFFSIAKIEANSNIAAALDIQEQQNNCEIVLKGAIKQLTSVAVVLEDLALTINNNAIRNIKNRRALIDSIKSLRDTIVRIQNDAFANVNEYSLAFLIHFIHGITHNINLALDEGLTDLKYFDLEHILAWQPKKEPVIDDLQKKLQANAQAVDTLKNKAQNAGLHWYNKAYRALDNHIIQPAVKHNIPARSQIFLTGSAVALLVWFYSNCEPNYEITKWARDKFGYGPRTSPTSQFNLDDEYHNGSLAKNIKPHPMRWPGNLAWWFISNTNGTMPGVREAMILFTATFWKEFGTLKEASGKQFTKLSNFLKGGTYANIQPTSNEDRVEPRYTFDDLVGCEHVKEVLSIVVKYIEDAERFDRAGLTPEKGYLLTGPTRTGKSMTAEALAGEIKRALKKNGRNSDDFGFYVINASYITQNGIGYYLELAKNYAPCILFIDEIDLLSLQRAGDKKLLGEFLSSMSGCMERDPKKQVIIVAATNRPENMDEALRQRGRFGKELRFDYPTFSERKEFLTRRLEKLSLNIASFDIDKLAQETDGNSYEDLTAIIRSAFQRTKIWGQVLTQYHLERSLDEEVRNIISEQNYEIPPREKHLIAVHQAGHALATVLLDGKYKLAKVTIKPLLAKLREELVWEQYYVGEEQKQKKIIFGKIFTFRDPGIERILTREDKIDQCKIQLAGHAAEKIVLGSTGYSYHTEETQQTYNQAKAIVAEGIDLAQMTDTIKTTYLEKALKLQKECDAAITTLLNNHKAALEATAAALEQYGTLTGQEVATLIKDPKAVLRKPAQGHQSKMDVAATETQKPPTAPKVA